MKSPIGILVIVFAGVCIQARQAPLPISSDNTIANRTGAAPGTTIVTQDGRVYEHCRILMVEPNGLLIEHTPEKGAIGLAKVRFSVLPPEIQKRFNYDAADAARFESL